MAHWIVSLLQPPITNVTGFSGAAGWVPGARLSWRQPLWRKSHGRCSGRYVPHHRKDTEIPPEESWTRSTSACASWRLRILPGLRSRLLTPRAFFVGPFHSVPARRSSSVLSSVTIATSWRKSQQTTALARTLMPSTFVWPKS